MRHFYVRLTAYLSFNFIMFGACFVLYLNYSHVAFLLAYFAQFVVLTILYFFFEHHNFVKQIKYVSEAEKKIASGEKGVRIREKPLDSYASDLVNQFNNMAAEFEKLEFMRTSFISNASHELRSPLTSIQGFIGAVVEGVVNEKDKIKYLKIALGETKRLTDIVTSMLNLSRLEAGALPLSAEPFDINHLVEEVITKFERRVKMRGISLCSAFESAESKVIADRPKIEQVLINLVDNAVKYSPDNSNILVGVNNFEGKAFVSVRDNGNGIPADDLPQIFDRFYTVDKARTPVPGKGVGLGLAITKKIISDHGEEIHAESVLGEGSVFTFTLPLCSPPAFPDDGVRYLP